MQALVQIDAILKQFKGELREETGPVQLWPHHIDLAMLWLSGRRVPGVDPADEENADDEISELLADVEQLLTEPQEQTVVNRLACTLSPNHPIKEIAGTGKMLTRLKKLVAALE